MKGVLQVDRLKVALDAEAGLVKAIDGLSLSMALTSAAKPLRWWANRVAARA